jgi:hypothetical protein
METGIEGGKKTEKTRHKAAERDTQGEEARFVTRRKLQKQ